MCARKGSFCDIHERYANQNSPLHMAPKKAASIGVAPKPDSVPEAPIVPKPPVEPLPVPVKTTEQKVGGHRIVKIVVGSVIITVQEPL